MILLLWIILRYCTNNSKNIKVDYIRFNKIIEIHNQMWNDQIILEMMTEACN